MKFEKALSALFDGKKISRLHWILQPYDGNPMRLFLSNGRFAMSESPNRPYVSGQREFRFGINLMLSDDWCIVDENYQIIEQ
jgi:hypothetical protein